MMKEKMRIEFWKHKFTLMTILIVIGSTFIGTFLLGVFIKNESAKLPLIIISFMILLLGLFVLFKNKLNFLSKIVISEESISVKKLKKQTINIDWSEVVEVKATHYGKGGRWLSIVSKDKQIDMDITKKIYVTIMTLCPYQSMKSMLNNVEEFKPLFDRYNQKIK